ETKRPPRPHKHVMLPEKAASRMKKNRSQSGTRTPAFARFLVMPALLAAMLTALPAPAQEAGEISPFAQHLAAPPALDTEKAENEAQPDCTAADSTRTSSLTCSAGASLPTRSASARNGYLVNPDIVYAPAPDNRQISQAIEKNRNGENEWEMGIELRNSPVTEAHGSAERHESVGGLIKGNMKF
ncbi:hypothetical protein LJC19_07375, partial [Oxalobacter sp. OttesenSCG-928-P03]|nr:hypothetical protein [Oxalobacter sp. OttesenSCG-928-P03]